MSKSETADAVRDALVKTSGDLKTQIALLDACIQANRLPWANETLAEIAKLAAAGNPLAQAVIASKAGGEFDNETGETKKPGGRRPWVPASPAQVKEVVMKMIGERPLVTYEGNLVVVSFNGYLLTKDKATRIVDSLVELVKRAHIVLFQETNIDALKVIAKAAGYGVCASHRNNREQACGMLLHPRLEYVGKKAVYHDYLLEVPGHPEFKYTLRPAIQQRVLDTLTGEVYDFVNVHTKSNVGGPDATRPIREFSNKQMVEEFKRQAEKSPYQRRKAPTAGQAKSEAADSAATTGGAPKKTRPAVDYSVADLPTTKIIMGGDFNAALEKATTTETKPLFDYGFKLEPVVDGRPSYQFRNESGQFDGFFTKGMDGLTVQCWIPAFPTLKRDLLFWTKDFSDHLPVFMEVIAPVKPAEAASAADAK
jgi:hypothetical protein